MDVTGRIDGPDFRPSGTSVIWDSTVKKFQKDLCPFKQTIFHLYFCFLSQYVYLRLVDLTGPTKRLVLTNFTREVDQLEINIPTLD